MAQQIIRSIGSDSKEVLSNILDKDTGKLIEFKEVSKYYDGTPMSDEKLDAERYLYIKNNGKYYLRVLDNPDKFLEKDTMLDMRNISNTEILLLKMGYYKGVNLNGYYTEGDTPTSIDYYISSTSATDDGGSVIEVGGVKLEHKFKGAINVLYFGIIGDNTTNNTSRFEVLLDFCKKSITPYQLKPYAIYVPRGSYIVDKIVFDYQSFQLYGDGSEVSVFKFTNQMADTIAGIYPLNDTLDTESPDFVFYKNIRIENIGCDPFTIGGGKSFIMLRNAYDFLIRGVNLPTDTFAGVNKFALSILDNVYTGSVENCYLPKINCNAQIAWTVTTITFINLRAMNVRMTNCLGMTFVQAVVQGKENEKFLINNCDTVSIIGGDMEDLGIYMNFYGNNSNIRSFGNNILALKGAYINGVPPRNSYFDDTGSIGIGSPNINNEKGKLYINTDKEGWRTTTPGGRVYNIMGNEDGSVDRKYTHISSASGIIYFGTMSDDGVFSDNVLIDETGSVIIGEADGTGAKLQIQGALSIQHTVSSSATTGSASELPTSPKGYLHLFINNEEVKIPIYNL